MPSRSAFHRFINKNPRAKKVYESIPHYRERTDPEILKERIKERIKNKNKELFSDRRARLPGFPKIEPFKSLYEVREYFKGSEIVCLICGKKYKKLGIHLRRIHGADPDVYRHKYSIPWTYGLCGNETSSSHSGAINRRIDGGFMPDEKHGDDHKKMVKAQRRKTPIIERNIFGRFKSNAEIDGDQ